MIHRDTYQDANALIDRLFIPSQRTVEWVEENIDLTLLTSCAHNGLVKLDPYQIPILDALDRSEVRTVTVMGCERLGKSVVWQWYLLKRLAVDPCPAMIVYPSDDFAADTNRDTVEPLMSGVPRLKAELERPFSRRKDAYHFSDSITYFQGSGSPILSKTVCLGIMDELDFHRSEKEVKDKRDSSDATSAVPNLMNLEKRLLNYRAQGLSKLIAVSSPTNPNSPIHEAYLASSQGAWGLRCQSCRQLIPSHAIHNLQWESDAETSAVVPSSLFLQCPHCSARHDEAQADVMNAQGAYIFGAERTDHQGFQFGALCCPRVWKWSEIADEQQRAGKTAELKYQKRLDNTVRGLPFKPRRTSKPAADAIKAHIGPLPTAESIKGVFMTADTQTHRGWFYTVRAYDDDKNSFLLDYGNAETIDDLGTVWEKTYLGKFRAMLGLIDEGGHLATTCRDFCSSRPGLYTYKGESNLTTSASYRMSPNQNKLINAKPYDYQEQFLYQVYSQTNRDLAPYWFLPSDVSDEYVAQIATVQKSKSANGHQYRNWKPPANSENHYFDCEKMQYVLLDFAKDKLDGKYWIGGSVPKWVKEELIQQVRSKVRR